MILQKYIRWITTYSMESVKMVGLVYGRRSEDEKKGLKSFGMVRVGYKNSKRSWWKC